MYKNLNDVNSSLLIFYVQKLKINFWFKTSFKPKTNLQTDFELKD